MCFLSCICVLIQFFNNFHFKPSQLSLISTQLSQINIQSEFTKLALQIGPRLNRNYQNLCKINKKKYSPFEIFIKQFVINYNQLKDFMEKNNFFSIQQSESFEFLAKQTQQMASQNEIQNYLTIAIRSDEYKINDKFETTTSLTIGSKLDSDSSLHQKRSSTLRKKREKKIINLSQKNSVETAIPATQTCRQLQSTIVSEKYQAQVKQTQDKKKKRNSDQNLCKKYHTVAFKCYKKVGIQQEIPQKYRKKYKKNYFLFILIIVRSFNKFDQFKRLYIQKIGQLAKNIQQDMRLFFYKSKQFQESKLLLGAIKQSIGAVQSFEQGHLRQAIQKLYDTENIRRTACIDEAQLQAQEFGLIFQAK